MSRRYLALAITIAVVVVLVLFVLNATGGTGGY
jgi:hypothetical protein